MDATSVLLQGQGPDRQQLDGFGILAQTDSLTTTLFDPGNTEGDCGLLLVGAVVAKVSSNLPALP